MIKQRAKAIFFIAACCIAQLYSIPSTHAGDGDQGTVLVIMSYDEKNDSEREIAEGLEVTLAGQRLRYFYLDTKNHLDQGPAKAAKAFLLYQELKPDVVIAADDTAQEIFVIPYLMGKTSTPIVFCGVNDSASQYGYPNAQVTGVIEKKHYRQSIGFAQLIDPTIKKIAVVYRETPTNSTNLAQIKREENDYGVTITSFTKVNSRRELLSTLGKLHEEADALLALNLAGIDSDSSEKMEQSAATALAAQNWNKPSIGSSKIEIEAGFLCGVAKTNIEQGLIAGKMALKILHGATPADIPVTENQTGQRMINATTASRLELKLKPMVLIGSTLVR